jgi:hypothetical protein
MVLSPPSLKLPGLGLYFFPLGKDRDFLQNCFESLHIKSDSQEAVNSLEFEI